MGGCTPVPLAHPTGAADREEAMVGRRTGWLALLAVAGLALLVGILAAPGCSTRR